MNYYWRRCVAAVLAVFLLAVAAPSAQAAKSAETKANLCKFILTLGWPAAESVNEMCEKVGVPLSVFPNAASGGYSGNELLANLEAAEKYYSQCKDEYAKAEEELKKLKEELANASTPAEAAEIQKKIDEIENNMKGMKDKIEDAKKQRDAWADKMKEYEGYTDEDWNKMAGELLNRYQQAYDSSVWMSDSMSQQMANEQSNWAKQEEEYKNKFANIEQQYKDGKISKEEYEKWMKDTQASFEKDKYSHDVHMQNLQDEKERQEQQAATYKELINNGVTGADAQSYYKQEAQNNYNSYQGSATDAENNYAQLQKELQDQQAALAAAQSGGDPDKIKELEAAVAQAEQNLNNAQYQLDLAGQDLNAAQQAYNNAQGGGSSGGEDCWYEKQCEKKCEKKCWKDENGDEKCEESCWDECEEVKVCK